MIRSNFAITRLILLPYAALLGLYLLIVGGGSTWLYYEVRAAQTHLLVADVLADIEPLAIKLGSLDAFSAMERADSWLVSDIERLFAGLPALHSVSLRDDNRGVEIRNEPNRALFSNTTSPLPAVTTRANAEAPAQERLHASSAASFLIRFDLAPESEPPVSLEFSFDRSAMLAQVDAGMDLIERAIFGFVLAGGVSTLIALAITVYAMAMTRKVEGHFQEIYQRASLTEISAQLVHELRNPLSALRANVKALLVSPEQTRVIADELDSDIVELNAKLSAFLKLTRQHDEHSEAMAIGELLADAVRLAEPVLSAQGIRVETHIPAGLPLVKLRRASMRDALLNILINAGQSGQRGGVIRLSVQLQGNSMLIVTEDSGEGIAPEHMPHLFEAFYTTRADGNGLGLAIVQRVAAAHQGQVLVENRQEGGARVVLSVPLQAKETPGWWNKLKKSFPV